MESDRNPGYGGNSYQSSVPASVCRCARLTSGYENHGMRVIDLDDLVGSWEGEVRCHVHTRKGGRTWWIDGGWWFLRARCCLHPPPAVFFVGELVCASWGSTGAALSVRGPSLSAYTPESCFSRCSVCSRQTLPAAGWHHEERVIPKPADVAKRLYVSFEIQRVAHLEALAHEWKYETQGSDG